MLDECYVVISHGPVLHSVLCTVSSHPCALHCALPAPEQLLLWFSTLWLAGLMARVKAWLLVPEILGTDLDNTEEELLLLLLLMLRLLLTYLLSGPSLSLSTETQELSQFHLQFALKHVRQTSILRTEQ